MRRRRTATASIDPTPWSEAEDDALREVCSIGLASDFWPLALPGRTMGAICERRLTLNLKMAPLL